MYGQFFVLFAIIFTGYFLRKIKFIDEGMNNGLNKFIVYFAFPCLLISKISNMDIDGLLKEFFIMLGISCAMFCLYGLFSYLYGRGRKFPTRIANVVEMSMLAPNNGFMGFPIALIFFGEQGLLLMMAHNVAMNFYIFTFGLLTLRRNNEKMADNKLSEIRLILIKIFLNPNILAILIGISLALTHIKIGAELMTYFTLVGNTATPMAMIFIGSTLAGNKFFDMFKNHIVWESAMVKLIILPLITVGLVYFLPVTALTKSAVVLGCCFPTAATISMLAQQEKQNEVIASKILFFTTIISMVTLPLSIKIIENIF